MAQDDSSKGGEESSEFLVRADAPEGADAIDLTAIRASLEHLRLDSPLVVQAFQVAQDLDVWLMAHNETGTGFHTAVTVWAFGVELSIAGVDVWSSQANDEIEDLTVEACLERYRGELADAMSVFKPGSEAPAS